MNSRILLLIYLVAIPLFAEGTGVTLGKRINIRQEPQAKSKILQTIPADLSLVRVIDASSIQNKEEELDPGKPENWRKIEWQNIQGFVFASLIAVFSDQESADRFRSENEKFRSEVRGNYQFFAEEEKIFDLIFSEDGTLRFQGEIVEGDHILVEKGEGRFFLYKNELILQIHVEGEFAPDGRSWSEYFALANGRKPSSKKELNEFIRARQFYKENRKYSIPRSELKEKLQKK
ncbi:hypothetical protein CH373_09030 [Leptospira perolatii]|uniref:Uncharacterized protein n=1 Tax=Leptospira perolatii TaxID=2023191 RepID=A0A2M9ZNX4_9LEPT|nr:hypothetical protein [Leptospira perolatii]PJZ69636.1 hypothetical protein CH360_10175 [Leptospira perolatii]PJZ73623.1 hypothetical protein CH373_09030 [Leptospira perolatii]